MVTLKKEIEAYVDSHRQEMLDLWRDVVNLEGNSEDLAGLRRVVERFKQEFESAGMQCTLLPMGDGAQDYLTGILNPDLPGKPVLFCGHYDTILPPGKYGPNPFRVEDGHARGPGVLDMKGGIVIALYVVKALAAIGFRERPIKICFVSDEESCHEHNDKAGETIMREAKGCLCAFNMETGRVNNDLCIGRSARVEFHVAVNGVSAHAGNDFTAGRNAIEEMCHKVLELQALTDLSQGSTVNCGVIQGGTVANAVPGRCELDVDMRFLKQSELENTIEKAQAICAQTHVEGTTTECSYRVAMPAFETIDGVMELYELTKAVSEEYGYGSPGKIVLGGVSDASYLTLAGTPTLCSCGVRGENNHTDNEYAIVESLYERSKLLAAVILNLGQFRKGL